MAFFCWHKWTKWIQYEERMWSTRYNMHYVQDKQKRSCEKCGYVQQQNIS